MTYGTRQAERAWRDLLASQRSAVVDARDYLTRHPHERSPKNHPLEGDLGTVTHAGATHEQWLHESNGGARLWFYVEGSDVVLVEVHTRHPNETK